LPTVDATATKSSRRDDLPPWQPPWNDPKPVEALYREFCGFLDSPESYEERICRDTPQYPEGPLLALCFPAYGLANYALANSESAPDCRERIDRLIRLASERWIQQGLHEPMRDDVLALKHWNGHGVFLGHYCLMLACYRLAGGDDRYADRQRRIASLLTQGVESDGNGLWIRSYPSRTWLFDTLPCLLAVRLTDAQDGRDLRPSAQLVQEHLRYRQTVALDRVTGLTASEVDHATGRILVGPRGCDASATICFLGHLAPGYCRDLYTREKKALWVELKDGDWLHLAGFREWPPGQRGFVDAASGPVVAGIGAAASGFGLGASRFARDEAVHRSLLQSLETAIAMLDAAHGAAQLLEQLNAIVRSEAAGHGTESATAAGQNSHQESLTKMRASKDYYCRDLMADVVAFYCLTWRPWCQPAVRGDGDDGT